MITLNDAPYSSRTFGLADGELTSKHRRVLSDQTTEAMSALNYGQPFFAAYMYDRTTISCLWPCDPLAAKIPTAATDGRHTYINAEFFGRITTKNRMGVLAHELCHDMQGHMPKLRFWTDRNAVLSRDGSIWLPWNMQLMNVAADAEINSVLKQAGFDLPEPHVLFEWVKPGEMTIEEIYQKLVEQIQSQQKPQKGKGEGGGEGDPAEGAAGSGDEGESEEGSDTPAGLSPDHGGGMDQHIVPQDPGNELDDADRKRALRAAVAVGKRAGNVPGSIERMVEELCRPLVDWCEVLRSVIVSTVGQDLYDNNRYNKRRYLTLGTIEPTRRSERCGVIGFIFDASGSTQPYIDQFFGEVATVVGELAPKAVHVLWTDTKVHAVDTLDEAACREDVAKLTMKGGGGTNLVTGFDWLKENIIDAGEDLAAIVVLTDSETAWPAEDMDYGCPVIVATTGPTLQHRSWMEVVEIDENEASRVAHR